MSAVSRARVVFDVNVFVGAVAGGNSPFRSWPSPPPTSGNPYADCVGIANDGVEFALWTSPHILTNVARVLTDPREGLGWDTDPTEEYLELIVEIAAASGGGVVEPREIVTDCPDHEDNRILEVAAEVDADLIVSADADLLMMSPWRGIPIVEPEEFASRVDVMRRKRRRR